MLGIGQEKWLLSAKSSGSGDSCKWLTSVCTELTQLCFGMLSRVGIGTWRQCELLLKHWLVLYGDSDGFVFGRWIAFAYI